MGLGSLFSKIIQKSARFLSKNLAEICHLTNPVDRKFGYILFGSIIISTLLVWLNLRIGADYEPKPAISKIDRAYQLPLTLVSPPKHDVDKDELIKSLKAALAMEKQKNVKMGLEVERSKKLIEEIFLASKLSLLAIDSINSTEMPFKEKQRQYQDTVSLDMISTFSGKAIEDRTSRPVALPKPRPAQIVDPANAEQITPPAQPIDASKPKVSSRQERPLSGSSEVAIRPAAKKAELTAIPPEISQILAGLAHQTTERGFKVVVPNASLFFRRGNDIELDARPILNALADVAKLDSALKLNVVGHTDSYMGADESRQQSEQKARLVKQFLVEELKIDPARISVLGQGRDRPIASNATFDGRRTNRRIEIWFSKESSN